MEMPCKLFMQSMDAPSYFYPFSLVNRYVLCVNIFIFDSLNEIERMLHFVLFVKLALMFSWKCFRLQFRYFLSHMIDLCGLIVLMWIEFCLTLDIITFVIFSIHNLLINCHTFLNLVNRDLFLRFRGVLPLWYFPNR